MYLDVNIKCIEPGEIPALVKALEQLGHAPAQVNASPIRSAPSEDWSEVGGPSTTEQIDPIPVTEPESEPEVAQQPAEPEASPASPEQPSPTLAPASAAPAASTGELDDAGVAWDAEVHSSGKTKYTSGKRTGQWVKKRGVSEETYDALYAAPASVPAAPADAAVAQGTTPPTGIPIPTGAVPADDDDDGQAPATTAGTPVGGTQVPNGQYSPAVASVDPNLDINTFDQFLSYVTDLNARQALSSEQIMQAVASVGCTILPDVSKKPEVIPQLVQTLQGMMSTQGAPA